MHSYSHSHNKTLHKVVTTSLPSQTTITHTSRSSLTFHFSLSITYPLLTFPLSTSHSSSILHPSLPPTTPSSPPKHTKKPIKTHVCIFHPTIKIIALCHAAPCCPMHHHAMPCHAMPKKTKPSQAKKKKAITRRLEGRKEKEKRRTPQNAGVF